MKISRLIIQNFRGIKSATIFLPNHAVLIGDNNTGKTTILEAIDLVLGPDRLNRTPPIDEHDFYQGKYLVTTPETEGSVDFEASSIAESGSNEPTGNEPEGSNGSPETPKIHIEATIGDLSEEQKARFGGSIEFWDQTTDSFYDESNLGGVDAESITEALRVTFIGHYDPEEDDFEGRTYFTRSLIEGDKKVRFTKKYKQICGFLYLRSIRTGSRALSLERGSLLDLILRLKEVRPQMWEDTIASLKSHDVASDPELGITGILESINSSLKKYVPKEWGIEPHLRVSNLTREHLRKTITAFIATGEGNHSAPFYRQGTGTVNMLVLAMLSQIAEEKQNVIFAMEEPETAIPPYAQKRIVHEIHKMASQSIFTSHSPYVLEEFKLEETLVLKRDTNGVLSQSPIVLPDNLKPKHYRQHFRTRFCEGLLTRNILIAEGATEAVAFPLACRRLSELNPDSYTSLEALGICTINADGDTNISGLAHLYQKLGKRTFAICDKQTDEQKERMESEVEILLMHDEHGFEDLVIKNTTDAALKRFANAVEWPEELQKKYPKPDSQFKDALDAFFKKSKGTGGLADFLYQCNSEDEIPLWIRTACATLRDVCESTSADESPIDESDTTNVSETEPQTDPDASI